MWIFEVSFVDTLQTPSVGGFFSGLGNRIKGLCFYAIFQAEVELVLLDQPAWSFLIPFVLVNWEHGEPAHFGTGLHFTSLGVPVQPLPVLVFEGVMHVLFLVWVLDHGELLSNLTVLAFPISLSKIGSFLDESLRFLLFVVEFNVSAFFQLSENVP